MHARPFLEALSTELNADIATRIAVGFGLLQQYGAIRDRGPDTTVDRPALAALHAQLDSQPARDREVAALHALADALPHCEDHSLTRLGRRLVYSALMQYGQALFGRGASSLAETVFELVAIDAELDGDNDLSAQARLLCGFAWRTLGNWEASQNAYERAYELSWGAGAFAIALRARVGLGYNMAARGDLPGARVLLVKTVARASRLAPEILPYAFLGQAHLESIAGRHEDAIALCYRAHKAAGANEAMQYASLIDLAQCLVDYGAPEVAEKALRAVLGADVDVRHRLQAQLHLLLVLATLRREAEFVALMSELAASPFTVRQQALYHLYVAQGFRAFGRLDEAQAIAVTAVASARDHALFQILFQSEEELRTIKALTNCRRKAEGGMIPAPIPKTHLSPRIARVARAINSLLV